MKRLIIMFSGKGLNAMNIIDDLEKDKYFVACCITNNKDSDGIEFIKKRGVDVILIDNDDFNTREDFDAELVKVIKSYDVDLVVLSGFMRILTSVFTSSVRAINIHPSLLPKFKGMNAIERSYDSVNRTCGVTVHWINEDLDAGEIITQQSFVKRENESFLSFKKQIKKIEFRIFPNAIRKVI